MQASREFGQGDGMIVCLGTTPTVQRTMVFERLKMDAVNRALSVRESASGKSVNVALTLRTLDLAPLAIGFAGGDGGRLLLRDLDAMGIAHEFVVVEPRTRTCTTVIDRSSGAVTELVEEPGAVEAGAYDRALQALEAHLPRSSGLVLSGSLPPGAPMDFYARCVGAAARAGVPVIVDGRGPALRATLAQRPTLIKPNRAELEETVGHALENEADLRRSMRQLIEVGPRYVVITQGAQGALATDGRRFWRAHAPAIQAVSPIGSGDAFAAGLIAGLARGRELPDCLPLALACGGANALNTPAGHARAPDIERLLPLARVEECAPA
jgi:tagatose 6-phosphate kinase